MSNQGYELSRWVGDDLTARKFPFKVVYGPERTARAGQDPVILIMRDTETSETVESPKGTQANGRKQATRRIPLKALVYARSAVSGARLIDHEELSDYLVDALICSIEDWNTSQKGGGISYGEMAFVTPDEVAANQKIGTAGAPDLEPEGWPGTIFLLRFTIGRGVVTRDYTKAVRPIGLLTGVSNTAEVRLKDSDDPAVEPPPAP